LSATAATPCHVVDVDAASFPARVLEASSHTPVLVDFWAAWCGPCKALTPLLERLAAEYDGAFVLAKVDTDANRELAMQMGIRSLPTVRLFVDGAAVAEFAGAHPESSLRAFLDEHLPRPMDGAALAQVEARLAAGDAPGARAALDALDARTRDGAPARALAARLTFLEAAAELPDARALESALAADPAHRQARYALALRLAAQGRYEEAMEALLAVLARDRQFADGAARARMLDIFEVLGDGDPRVPAYRSRLASTLN